MKVYSNQEIKKDNKEERFRHFRRRYRLCCIFAGVLTFVSIVLFLLLVAFLMIVLTKVERILNANIYAMMEQDY